MKKVEKAGFVGIVLLSSVLNFANLAIEGTSNAYYAAAVKSMIQSWHNFFFTALDPAGFVTVDKPPLGLWMQAISAKIFGFSGFSILLPQALSGVLSVLLLMLLVKKYWGVRAALLSGLFLAITPVFVAVSRNNTMDNQLVFALLVAAFLFLKGLEKGKVRYLLFAMAVIGLGFNIKSLQAYMILPAIYLTYLFSSSVKPLRRVFHLALGTVVLCLVSFSWAFAVDQVSETNRPYVGCTEDNSEISLIFSHNGLERLSGENSQGMGGGFQGGSPPSGNGFQRGNAPSGEGGGRMPSGNSGGVPPSGGFSGGGNQLSGTFGAQTTAGLGRLFSKNILSDQIVWFLPLALLGLVAAGAGCKLTFRLNTGKKRSLVFLGMWLIPEFIYFSFTTGLFHPHYLTMMAPPIAALAGIGLVSALGQYRKGGLGVAFLPLMAAAGAAVQLLMAFFFYEDYKYVRVLAIILGVVSVLSILGMVLAAVLCRRQKFLVRGLVILCIAGQLLLPASGSFAALTTSVNSQTPAGGLELLPSIASSGDTFAKGKDGDETSSDLASLVSYLEKNKTGGKASLVVSSATTAENLILNTDLYIGSLTGFMGSEKVMSLDRFKKLIQEGSVCYVLDAGNEKGSGNNNEIMTWVRENGEEVTYSENGSAVGTLYQVTEV